MRLSLEQLTAFCSVASEKSFSAAARKLGKSQSAVSISVANLEIDLGVILFDRSSRYPSLTNHGISLLRDAEAILHQCSSMENRANSIASELESQVVVAIDDAIPFQLLNHNLAAFGEKFPFVDLNILHPSSHYVQQSIEQGDASLGVMCAGTNYPQHLHFKRLGNITFVNVAHKNHPLTRLPQVSFDDLNRHRQLVYLPLRDSLPTSEYLSGSSQWRMGSYLALMNTLSAGMGWATVPKQLIIDLQLQDELVELALTSYPHTQWTVGVDLVWSSNQRFGQAVGWLRDALGLTPI
ncbi:LysR family transcriptional regulator [uncultured Alteromonas sp.]|uniref:LysR family transcriptional regulator n=1 Tax=uncultured Alteromonas sp. TaxID=179113 RepID=UPI0030ED47B4|tara:strand:+ start:5498 stop:6382 length:885 start_codon:yes stop_codon:yes gene_type:complete